MRRHWPLIAAGLSLTLVLTAIVTLSMRGDDSPVVVGPAAAQKPVPTPSRAGRLADRLLYVDPQGAAIEQAAEWERAGRTEDARTVRRIADQPTATWFADDSPGYAQRARQLVTAATAAGRLPVLTFYNIPYRDCSGQSAGGAADAEDYRSWVRALAASLDGHRALIVLEPDAIPQAVQGCLDAEDTAERYTLLAEAVDALRALPGVLVYLDAGNPTWIEPGPMTTALRRSGIERAYGFALNVANFETTEDNLAYGARLSTLLGGTHFVIDTSRNGNGPAQKGAGDRHWCNPSGRALGETPTTRTGVPLADAFLWIKRPGESDGACGSGAPPAGQWWPEYALDLAGPPS
ncbi:glycoside hydrolase family 6 protein [Actinoplanes friuliensis]|uniref:Glucanase n=1 Tax=Actinoplanes friuliensis DSM 7358 TaxID=1246995 RepID=U5VQU5_9ACTN|nr:glycoside hydrolase family 6 protein [Actinoplanes friuliensis]AGZ39343.1 putative secreted endoglucanase [Actinoplanes friuliensis DSM 7358]